VNYTAINALDAVPKTQIKQKITSLFGVKNCFGFYGITRR